MEELTTNDGNEVASEELVQILRCLTLAMVGSDATKPSAKFDVLRFDPTPSVEILCRYYNDDDANNDEELLDDAVLRWTCVASSRTQASSLSPRNYLKQDPCGALIQTKKINLNNYLNRRK